MNRFRLFVVAFVAVALAITSVAGAEVSVPKRDGFVTDVPGKLGTDEAKLEAKLKGYFNRSNNTVAILVVQSLASIDADDIADVGYEVGNSWGVGDAGADNGVLITVALDDRKMRIDTGKGVEGDLTDGECSDIINNVMKPAFKKGDFYGGLDRATGVIAHELTPTDESALTGPDAEDASSEGSVPTWLVILIILIIVIIIFVGIASGSLGSGGGGSYGGSSGSWGSGSSGGGGGFGGGDFGGGGSGGGW